MKIGDRHYRTIWLAEDGHTVEVIDQTLLPHQFVVLPLNDLAEAAAAIRDMVVRGAPLIGATAAYGMALAVRADAADGAIEQAHETLLATRPTAVNLRWALDDMRRLLLAAPTAERQALAYRRAAEICDDDVATCHGIGVHGKELIAEARRAKGGDGPINVLTHC
ncbi:MAG: S-methyl-5-thioribose-1-phosphate isomerase, partial [Alphaproteobacteria bacterium]|nr:S-methyl-5-thioribose-1-phosphate isomerase [Alphaproteobacteria bacterium]